ncbi:unnamed protein product [Symbiodinium microadriaticum]|nr:unnamed protein product [Symbiodinium microadriaticum]
MSKITFLVVDEVPPRPADFIDTQLHAWMKSVSYDAFWVDHFQRAFVRDFIDRNSKTVYICTDADEIPSRELVASFRDEWMYDAVFTRKTIHIAMYMFYYNFHWAMPSMWTHAFAIGTERYLAQRDLVQSRVITDMEEVELVRGGWHLSYFLSREDIVRKVESFPHREYDLAEFKTDEHVTECLQMGKDMYKRDDVQLIPVDLEVNDHLWPQGWREYQQYVMRLQGLAP